MVASALLIIYCAIAVPLEIAFDAELKDLVDGWGPWSVFNFCVDILFLVDIVVNFRTGYLVEVSGREMGRVGGGEVVGGEVVGEWPRWWSDGGYLGRGVGETLGERQQQRQ